MKSSNRMLPMNRAETALSKTRSFWGRLCITLFALMLTSLAMAGNNKLLTVAPADSEVGETRLVFSFEQAPDLPRQFELSQPPRLVLDFNNTLNDVAESYLPYSTGVVSGIRLAEAGNRTRAVINLTEAATTSVAVNGKDLTISLKRQAVASAGQEKKEARKALTGIDFRRGENGEGLVKLELSDPSTVVDVVTRGQEVVLDLRDTQVPDDQLRMLDVIDFATQVRTIDVTRVGPDTRVIITSQGKFEQTSFQIDNAFLVEITEPPTVEKKVISTEANKVYSGEKLSLNFQNIEIRAILQIIADFTGLNIVVSDSVAGNLTLRLKQVPWDQALDIILKTQGLAKRQKDNVILVAPSEEIAAREKLELESQQQISELSPLITEVIKLEYAQAEVVFDMFKEAAGGKKDQAAQATEGVPTPQPTKTEDVSQEQGFLSARGAIGFDERTNSILLKDTRAKIEEIKQVLDIIDVPVAQVMVESRIVIATDSFSRDIGVQLGVAQDSFGGGTTKTIGGVAGGQRSYTDPDTIVGFSNADGQNQSLVDLPAASPTSGLGLFLFKANNFFLDLEITAAELEGDAEVIASPRVVTADRQKATITQGLEIPYTEVTGTGADRAVSIAFKEALLQLEVTPQITPGDEVLMDLEVLRQDPNDARSVNGNPAIDTRSITSQVLVNDGDTVVLGGIYERTLSNTIRKVPFFGDLPVIGNLFKRTTKSDERNELLVFVRPTVLRKNIAAASP